MHTSSPGRRLAGALRLAAIAVGLAVPPVTLAVLVGNPLPSWPIDWGNVFESVQAGLVPTDVWINVLAVSVYGLWAGLVGMLALEVVAVVRHRPVVPGVPGWVRQLAQLLVSATLALGGTTHQAAAALVDSPATVVAAAPAFAETDAPPPGTQLEAGEGRLVTVADGDSWAGFADQTVGDASVGYQLREANLGRQVAGGHTITEHTAFVEPGWRLVIPDRLDRPAATPVRSEAVAAADADHDRDPDRIDAAAERVWEVQPGDHFWSIAATTLQDELGRPPTDGEIVPYWQQVMAANTGRLLPPHDPDLIYPGQQLLVPEVDSGDRDGSVADTDPAATRPDTNESPLPRQLSPDRAEATDPQDPPPAPTSSSRADDSGPAADAWRPDGPSSHRAEGAGKVTHAPPRPPADELRDLTQRRESLVEAVADEGRTAWGASSGLAGGVAATMVAAAGVVALLRRRRRAALQRRPHGLQLPTPTPQAEAHVGRLEAAAAADRSLDDLVGLLGSLPTGIAPQLVELDDDGYVRLGFDTVPPAPPPPWMLTEDDDRTPVGWQAKLGASGPYRSVGLPLLVTVGRLRDGVTLLVNVGAIGHVVVDGNEPLVRDWLRTAALEVATSRIAGPVEVAVAGDDLLADVDNLEMIDDVDQPLAAAIADSDFIIEDRTARLLVCHPGAAVPALPAGLDGMLGVVAAAQPATGTDPWRLELVSPSHGWLRRPDRPPLLLVLPELDPQIVADELDRLEHTVPATAAAGDDKDAPADANTAAQPTAPPAASSQGDAVVVPMRSSPVEPAWCEVALLGPIEVVRDGEPVDGLTPKLLNVLACLVAKRPDAMTLEQLENQVWEGSRPRAADTSRVRNTLSDLRKVLGDGPDGQPLLPRRPPSGGSIHLSKYVGSDLDRAAAHIDMARSLPPALRHREQLAALALVRGEPFQGLVASWTTHRANQMIGLLQDVALDAAAACRTQGDYDTAWEAIERGMRLFDPADLLYLEWARLEIARGRPDQILRIKHLLLERYRAHADETAGWVAALPERTERAFQQLQASVAAHP